MDKNKGCFYNLYLLFMNAFNGISLKSKLALTISGVIMVTFLIVKTLLLFKFFKSSEVVLWYEFLSVVFFIPPFITVVEEFLYKKKEVTKDLNRKNVYLEHAAKIIRHDMHSGINTYLPRGIKSLKRRLSEDDIKKLKIESPLRLIEDGLHHARKVYSGVYEFTNLFKQNSQMNASECDVKSILNDYLKLTAYKHQVVLNDNLPKNLLINEPLFCTAVDNLIRNGLKYNDSKTKWVKIYYEEQDDMKFISVEDNGRGMSQEDFEMLSKPYIRKEGQQEEGTGLGLNICKEILKEHGFTIKAQKLETGTKLTIKI